MTFKVELGVSAHFCAAHYEPGKDVPHGHTWLVEAWFQVPYGTDIRVLKARLDTFVAKLDHTLLPEGLAWAEDLARSVYGLSDCVEAIVSRPLEGLRARWPVRRLE